MPGRAWTGRLRAWQERRTSGLKLSGLDEREPEPYLSLRLASIEAL